MRPTLQCQCGLPAQLLRNLCTLLMCRYYKELGCQAQQHDFCLLCLLQQLWPFDVACLRPTTRDGTVCPKRLVAPPQADALHQFVEKEEKAALADCLSSSLAATLSVSMANEETADAIDRGLDLSALLRQAAAQRRTQQVTFVCRNLLQSDHRVKRMHLCAAAQLVWAHICSTAMLQMSTGPHLQRSAAEPCACLTQLAARMCRSRDGSVH
jgi:hypothetical protein